MEKPEKVLSLDISTKTGYSLGIISNGEFQLVVYGQVPKIECPDENYPGSYVKWAYKCWDAIEKLIEEHQPDVLIIEEVTKSRNAMSQKILDFVHFLVARFIRETGIKNFYFMTGTWRKETDTRLNDEEKKRNKEVKKYKKEHGTKLAYDIKGRRVGAINKKHVAIRRVNELFGIKLKMKDNDTAESILLAYSYYLKELRKKNE